MHQLLNPPGIAPPASRYSHGVVVTGPIRWLAISGQIGTARDGSVPADTAGQMELAWDNLLAVLAAGAMAVPDIVKLTVFLTDPADVPLYRQVRDRRLAGHAPATTLLIVAGLASPSLKVEIEALAASAAAGVTMR